jgi:hypothetical protein
MILILQENQKDQDLELKNQDLELDQTDPK